METNIFSNTAAGTIGGTFLVLILGINGEEIMRTALMATIGAATSFMVSVFLKHLIRKFRRK